MIEAAVFAAEKHGTHFLAASRVLCRSPFGWLFSIGNVGNAYYLGAVQVESIEAVRIGNLGNVK
jgi:hypothetical protein